MTWLLKRTFKIIKSTFSKGSVSGHICGYGFDWFLTAFPQIEMGTPTLWLCPYFTETKSQAGSEAEDKPSLEKITEDQEGEEKAEEELQTHSEHGDEVEQPQAEEE